MKTRVFTFMTSTSTVDKVEILFEYITYTIFSFSYKLNLSQLFSTNNYCTIFNY